MASTSLETKKDKTSKRSKLKLLLRNFALICGSLLLFFILGEMVLRYLGYGDLVIYQADSRLFWKPLPNQKCYTKFNHKPVYINSKGTRGKDFDEKKVKNGFRIISLGDSKTFGWGLSDLETYSALLKKLLQNQVGNKLKIEVINAGVNAWSYAQMYVYLKDIGLRYRPDMVILADANLWSQFSEESSKEFREKMVRRVRLKNLLRRSAIYHFVIEVKLKKFYGKYRTKFIPLDPKRDDHFKKEQQADPNRFFEEQILKIVELLNNNNLKFLMLYIPPENILSSNQKPILLKIKEKISKLYNITLIDFTEDFQRANRILYHPNDPVHPNADGNKIISNRIFQHTITELDRYY